MDRRTAWWVGMVTGVLALALVAGLGWLARTPHSLHVTSLMDEWWSCLRHGEPPAMRGNTNAQFLALTVPAVRPRALLSPSQVSTAHRPLSPSAWMGLPPEEASAVHALATRPVRVAVIDSGVDAAHPGFDGRVRSGLDLVNPCGDGRQDVTGHGTKVAGIIATATDSTSPGVEIVPVRVQAATGNGNQTVTAFGIAWAAWYGADVINVSMTSKSTSPTARRLQGLAVRYAKSQGAIVVASAGNRPDLKVGYPAALPGVISVAAVGRDDRLTAFSTVVGPIDVAAPGQYVRTYAPGGGHTLTAGTSVAAPLVSATVARLLTADPSLDLDTVRSVLRFHARPVRDADVPFGVTDPGASLATVRGNRSQR